MLSFLRLTDGQPVDRFGLNGTPPREANVIRRHPPSFIVQVFVAHFIDGLTYAQVAAKLGTTRSAVSGIIYRHRGPIADQLDAGDAA